MQAGPSRVVGVENLLGKIGWPGAVVISALVTAVVLLAWPAHKDLQDIVIFIGGVGAAFVAWNSAAARRTQDDLKQQQAEIKVQVNGNNDALRAQVQQAYAVIAQQADQYARLLAQVTVQLPRDATLPAALTDPTHPNALDALTPLAITSGAGAGASSAAATVPIPRIP